MATTIPVLQTVPGLQATAMAREGSLPYRLYRSAVSPAVRLVSVFLLTALCSTCTGQPQITLYRSPMLSPCQNTKAQQTFVRDPLDCSLFYTCFGNRYWKRSCTTPGTVYSIKFKVCVWRNSLYDDCTRTGVDEGVVENVIVDDDTNFLTHDQLQGVENDLDRPHQEQESNYIFKNPYATSSRLPGPPSWPETTLKTVTQYETQSVTPTSSSPLTSASPSLWGENQWITGQDDRYSTPQPVTTRGVVRWWSRTSPSPPMQQLRKHSPPRGHRVTTTVAWKSPQQYTTPQTEDRVGDTDRDTLQTPTTPHQDTMQTIRGKPIPPTPPPEQPDRKKLPSPQWPRPTRPQQDDGEFTDRKMSRKTRPRSPFTKQPPGPTSPPRHVRTDPPLNPYKTVRPSLLPRLQWKKLRPPQDKRRTRRPPKDTQHRDVELKLKTTPEPVVWWQGTTRPSFHWTPTPPPSRPTPTTTPTTTTLVTMKEADTTWWTVRQNVTGHPHTPLTATTVTSPPLPTTPTAASETATTAKATTESTTRLSGLPHRTQMAGECSCKSVSDGTGR